MTKYIHTCFDRLVESKMFYIIFILIVYSQIGFAQLSPGDLASPHAHLEGLSNCTECHTLGKKVSKEKCLKCHELLKSQIDKNKGYHSSKEIKEKKCISCHSDHNGRKFEMIRFDIDTFDHALTGYKLQGAHEKIKCEDCHKTDFIQNSEIKKKKNTFLGMNTDCLSCHTDYHQQTLSDDCMKCHNYKAFTPAEKFNHENTKYKLQGKHQNVKCIDCHLKTKKNGLVFQEFSGVKFESCTSCHDDIHKNKFGQNCTKCHDVWSFQDIKGMSDFDHNKTRYKLENLHKLLDCKKCHKTKLTDPIRFQRCTDCHNDFHEGQFKKKNISQDCKDCHSTKGFKGSSYTIELHNKSEFPLEGAHLATPCFVCHKDKEKWDFKNIGTKCSDCHKDIHKSFIDPKYYPENNCEKCHSAKWWADINFDHSKTNYKLTGAHQKQTCRSCHFKPAPNGGYTQKFSTFKSTCTECHTDEHQQQFNIEGETNCLRCHTNNDWKAEKFDHDKTRFVLDGKHENVACAKCHKETQTSQTPYIQYQLKEFKCESCH